MFPSELIIVTISCQTDAVCVHNTFMIISVASDAAINKLHFPKILIPVLLYITMPHNRFGSRHFCMFTQPTPQLRNCSSRIHNIINATQDSSCNARMLPCLTERAYVPRRHCVNRHYCCPARQTMLGVVSKVFALVLSTTPG